MKGLLIVLDRTTCAIDPELTVHESAHELSGTRNYLQPFDSCDAYEILYEHSVDGKLRSVPRHRPYVDLAQESCLQTWSPAPCPLANYDSWHSTTAGAPRSGCCLVSTLQRLAANQSPQYASKMEYLKVSTVSRECVPAASPVSETLAVRAVMGQAVLLLAVTSVQLSLWSNA